MKQDLLFRILHTGVTFGIGTISAVNFIYVIKYLHASFANVYLGMLSLGFALFSTIEFCRSLKGYKWGLLLYTFFDSTKMVVELTDFQNEKYNTIVSKATLTGFVHPSTNTGRLRLQSDGGVTEPIFITWWQPARPDLHTEHYLKNYNNLQSLQATIRKKAV
jgi:hypothetical protein